MPTQADLDWDNTVSKNRQEETRNQRSRAREMKDRMNSALRDATSTKERREIKREFNLNTNKASSQTDNQMGVNEDSNQRGDDNFKPDYYEIPEGGGGASSPLYAFKVVNDGDGTVSVTTGTVNTSTATGLTPSGKPTVLWLKVTFDTSGNVTAAIVATTPGATSATNDARQIASITWDGDTPTIVQGIKGSQSIASCGATHQWGTLYS